MPIVNTFFSATAGALVARLTSTTSDRLDIPEHQREFVWTEDKQKRLIKTLQNGRPMPTILIRMHDSGKYTLEDGYQRLSTLKAYFEDRLMDEKGLKFSQNTDLFQFQMKAYVISITQYAGATDEEAIDIFDSHQNGIPLSVGERLFSLASLSPLVRAIRNKILTPGTALNARATAVWGLRSIKSGKRCVDLVKIFAVCAGLVFGPNAISRKWDDISKYTRWSMTEPIFTGSLETRDAFLERMLDRLIGIFEAAQSLKPVSATKLKKQFDPGFLSGYIAYSLYKYPDEYERLKDRWVEYMVESRDDIDLHKSVLHADLTKARSWNDQRWRMGYLRVFDPEEANRVASSEMASTFGSEEGSDEDDDM
jgi:hypothetical protein